MMQRYCLILCRSLTYAQRSSRVLERAGITAPSRCRSGECSWCRSKLVSGEVFVPEKTDGRRRADIEFGYIHPCASFPMSDIVLDVPNSTLK